ncbi:hypothetical protein B296_00009256 [Ensete ventricosum]|uniref:SAC domain-containing protein n=1 Tax=Ensete ventricosum TaxID=4639 RepID=A0A427AK81_ENSVE|nr:hypothetical protein B296_00009256 [Ensete ventricosum]
MCYRRHYSGELLCNSPDSSEVAVSSYGSSWKDEVHNSDIAGSEFSGDKTKQNEDSLANEVQNSASSQNKISADKTRFEGDNFAKMLKFQKGVLRTNCIDCLDRTNVAQYAYGLAALGYQLYELGFMDLLKVDLDSPLADDLMALYERMGDTLALQYGGSAAHNKVFFCLTYMLLLTQEVEPKQGEPAIDAAQGSNLGEFSDRFAHWVAYGGTLCY